MMASDVRARSPAKRGLLKRIVDNGRLQPLALYAAWIGVVLGIVWVLAHPVATITTGEQKSRGTYFSENALLIDSTMSDITDASWAKKLHKEYISLDATDENGCELHSTCTHVMQWIESKLLSIPGVNVYRQQYTQHLYDAEFVNRTNIYAVLRGAPLVDGKESLVLVVQYPNIPATSKNGFSALTVGLAMLQYLHGKKWLAKDVVLLLTDDGPNDGRDGYSPGVEAWLRSYHSDPFSTSSALEMHAGVIRGAINLETSLNRRKYNSVGIFTAGINGQLPNLDLVNSAVETLENERIPIVLDRCADSSIVCDDLLAVLDLWVRSLVPRNWDGYLTRLLTMFRFIATLATGPSGPHANFIHYNIDAITLTALHSDSQSSSSFQLTNFMRAIATVVRGISNLEEKFHQSFYFYLLPTTRTFVSIGEYYYPMVLLMLPLFAHTLYIATNTGGLRLAFALAAFASAASLGLVLLVMTTHLSLLDPIVPLLDLAKNHPDTLSRSYCWTLVGLAALLQLVAVRWVVPALSRHDLLEGCVDESQWLRQVHDHRKEFEATKSEKDQNKDLLSPLVPYASDVGWHAVKGFAAIFVIVVHCAMGILNFSLALLCTLPMVLLIASAKPAVESSVLHAITSGVLLSLFSPVGSLLLLDFAHPSAMDGLAYGINGYMRHNLLTVPYLCLVYFPVHTLMLWVYQFQVAPPKDPSSD
ncbi:hypothetical protein, variant [Aphanomyces invadans]|uniref:Uncharacterized protein n=1 Tax=Aphanomyces invadans TaxID=157072 RepID=A0A024UV69_9STRA|nr:hypothetical protein, variant [Aphanomyces invadans]ETW09850.1 hypothetical protein, variant [Aphanomyces invadans]|eukprot:XP_008861261.1 hypothetical protein, variant [Aphanomyces invadans]